MFETAVVLVFVMVVLLVFVLLPIMLVIRAVQRLFKPAVDEVVSSVRGAREHKWKQAEAFEGERMVRKAPFRRVTSAISNMLGEAEPDDTRAPISSQ